MSDLTWNLSRQHSNFQPSGGNLTVPDGGESGAYALMVRAFVMTVTQPYTLDVFVGDTNGRDLTATNVQPLLGETTLITTNPHCQLI